MRDDVHAESRAGDPRDCSFPRRGSRVSQPCAFDFTSSLPHPSYASSFVFIIAYRVHGKQNPKHSRKKNVEHAARGRTRIVGSFANSSYLRPPIFHQRGNCSIWLTIALIIWRNAISSFLIPLRTSRFALASGTLSQSDTSDSRRLRA